VVGGASEALGQPASLTGAAAAVDRALGGVRAKRVAVVGLGKSPGPAEVRLAAAAAVRAASAARARSVAFALDGVPLDAAEATRCAVDGAALAGYRFTRYLTAPADERPGEVASLAVVGGDRAQARLSAVLTEATNRARDLQNTPPRDMGPQELADRARELAKEHSTLTARVHDRAWMERRGMGLFLAVAQGSSRPPLTIVLRHKPRRAKAGVVLGLVGKGLTYDAGGYTLKPAHVISVGSSLGFEWTATIDVGSRDGVRVNATVVNGKGLVGRVKRDCALRRWGLGLVATKGAKRARVAVARKLAALLHTLWRTNSSFRWA